MSSPDHSYITIDLPPASPPEYIHISGETSPNAIFTPTRQTRNVKPTRGKKRKRRRSDLEDTFDDFGCGVDTNFPLIDTNVTACMEDIVLGQSDETTGTNPMTSPSRHAEGDKERIASVPETSEESALFTDAVMADELSFYQISKSFFVVNGWDRKAKASTNMWYHLQMTKIGTNLIAVCQCPLAKVDDSCPHVHFLQEYQEQKFPMEGDDAFLDSNNDMNPVLFSRQQDQDEKTYLNHFSVPPTSGREVLAKNRAIVSFLGEDTGIGTWTCNKDPGHMGCSHIIAARHLLQKLVKGDPLALDAQVSEDASMWKTASQPRRAVRGEEAVSYLPIPPPIWARIPSDTIAPIPAPPLQQPPPLLPLTPTSSCRCTSPRVMYNPSSQKRQIPCTIYTLTKAWKTTIEVQNCSHCVRRVIGPDCQELRLFNLNNRVLFTHDLLDDYTCSYTTSETPFAAYVALSSKRYETHASELPFVSEQMFVAAWFAFVHLQSLDNDMQCPKCGPTPDVTIWDGVTLAFNRKHLLPSLRPPTVLHEDSITRTKTRYVHAQQALSDRETRKLVQKVLRGPSLIRPTAPVQPKTTVDEDADGSPGEETEEEPADDGGQHHKPTKALKDIVERVESIPILYEKLVAVDADLASLFARYFGLNAVLAKQDPPEVYREFFLQLSAEESILQMTTKRALVELENFIKVPSREQASTLVNIPALRAVLAHEYSINNTLPQTVLGTCIWLHKRATEVLKRLVDQSREPNPPQVHLSDGSRSAWESTGCYYGLPQVRHRPKYPKLKHDTRGEAGGKRGSKCSKFYSAYGKNRLTGGIMCVWCTHSICYGFHCIPKGEGRNDVFSALVTRWEKAPKMVVYDFACALGPYCMTREPEFFADTMFVIDDFHSQDHTKCSRAAFLKTYCYADPRLSAINSSAGECGNSGIRRIRKSVSYMAQDRAIVYTKVFLSIWNRIRIRKILTTWVK